MAVHVHRPGDEWHRRRGLDRPENIAAAPLFRILRPPGLAVGHHHRKAPPGVEKAFGVQRVKFLRLTEQEIKADHAALPEKRAATHIARVMAEGQVDAGAAPDLAGHIVQPVQRPRAAAHGTAQIDPPLHQRVEDPLAVYPAERAALQNRTALHHRIRRVAGWQPGYPGICLYLHASAPFRPRLSPHPRRKPRPTPGGGSFSRATMIFTYIILTSVIKSNQRDIFSLPRRGGAL